MIRSVSRLLAAALSLCLVVPALAQVQPGQSPLSGSKGGTGNAFMQFTGPASSIKTYALPNASDTIATLGAIQTFTAAKTFNAGFTAAQSVFNNPVPFYFIGDIDTAKWAMSLGGYGLTFLSDNTDTYVAPGGSGTKTLASRTYRPKVVLTPTGQVNAQSLQTDGLAAIGTLAVIGTGGSGGTLYFGPNTTGVNVPALGVNNSDNVLYVYSRGAGIDFRSLANAQLLKLSDGGLLQFQGASSSFPALKRSGAELHARLADDSGYANLRGANIVASASVWASAGGNLRWDGSRSAMASPADGIIGLYNNAGTDFGRLQFGGTTSSFPAIKRSGNAIHVRLADDTAYTSVVASNYNADSLTASRLVATDGAKSFSSTITSANLAASISDETGSGSAVFGTNPSISGATIAGGTINNTPIGGTTPNSGAFSTLTASTPVGVASGGTGGGTASGTLLDNITGFGSTGMMARTAAGTYAFRTVTAPAAGITISNGDGVSGNPTLALANDLSALEALSGTGIARRTGTDTWSVGTAVANSELATMGTGTFKGNVSGSTAAPSDLTATQVTAALNAVVGDSGAGGTKGLVPAPGAGDASAGKYLKADGTWAVPAGGGGGGGGMTDTERQNFLLSTIYQSKNFGGYRRLINLFADGFKASDGINAGLSSNYTVDTTNGYVSPTSPSSSISMAGGTNIGDMTANGGLAAVFDGNTSQSNTSSASRLATTAYVGKVLASSSKIASAIVYGSSNFGVSSGGSAESITLSLYGRTSGTPANSTDGTLLGTVTYNDSDNATPRTITSTDTTTTYSAMWVKVDAAANLFIAELQATAPSATNNMTLVSTTQTASSSVSNGRALIEYNPIDAITLNTDLTIEVSCNGGTNYASATLSSAGLGQAGRSVAETADTACTAGTSFQYRLKTLNNKNLQINGSSLTVH